MLSKVQGRWKLGGFKYLGSGRSIFSTGQGTVAATDAWIVAGAALATERIGGTEEGAVQVFTAAGTWVREILPPLPVRPGHHFGNSLAINGNLLIVGAPDDSGPGKAYIYDLRTGALVRNLFLSESLAVDRFGAAVASAGDWVAIGAPATSTNRGSVYLFNLKTQSTAKFSGSNAASNHFFGTSLAIEGGFLLVGAPGRDQFRGAGHVYDMVSLQEIAVYQPASVQPSDQAGTAVALQSGWIVLGAPGTQNNTGAIHVMHLTANIPPRVLFASDGAAGRYLGSRLALNQGMVLAGAPNVAKNSGAAYVFDVDSQTPHEIRKLTNPQGGASLMGFSVAWAGNTAVLAAPEDNDQSKAAGALILMRPITRPAPMSRVAARGDFAPGVVGATFDKFGDAFINVAGRVALVSTLAGPGSNGGKDSGVWTSIFDAGQMRLSLKSRRDFLEKPIALISTVSSPLPLLDEVIIRGTVTGRTLKSYEKQGIYWDYGKEMIPLFRTGNDPKLVFSNGVPQTFHEVRASRDLEARQIALSYTLRSGVANTTLASDSGVSVYSLVGAGAADSTRVSEGLPIGESGKIHGQFATSRLAFYHHRAAYAGAIAGLPATNQGVFRKAYGLTEILVVQKGDIPPEPGGIGYSSFLGETVDYNGKVLFRATLGAPATVTNNEGLWSSFAGTYKLLFRKGADLGAVVPELAGTRIAKFISYTMDYNAMALVQLTGNGVSAANDQALLIYDTEDHTTLLMREGDAAPGCDGARIGVISRVEREPWSGQYLVLTTLSGATLGTEQALFRGFSAREADDPLYLPLRRPTLALRKGWQFDAQPSKIKSIHFSTGGSASGAGSLGLGRSIQEVGSASEKSECVISVEFANGVRQIMKGKL